MPLPPPAEENNKFSTHYARNTPQKSPPDEENHKETLQATKLLRGGVLPQPKDENIVKKIRTLGESPPHPSNPKNKNLQKKNPREIFKNLVKEEFTPKKLQKRRTLDDPPPKNIPPDNPPSTQTGKNVRKYFEKNLKWNEIENVRGQGLKMIKVIDKGLEFTTRRERKSIKRKSTKISESTDLGSKMSRKKVMLLILILR